MLLIGSESTNNCECVHSEHPATLYMQQKLSTGLLIVRTIADLVPGQELLMGYGNQFWKETKTTAIGTTICTRTRGLNN